MIDNETFRREGLVATSLSSGALIQIEADGTVLVSITALDPKQAAQDFIRDCAYGDAEIVSEYRDDVRVRFDCSRSTTFSFYRGRAF